MVYLIKPCVFDYECDEVRFVEDEVAEFYGVYRVESDDSLTHCMDFATKSGAERYKERIRTAH